MNKASLIGWSDASWAEAWWKGGSEPCGHLRRVLQAKGAFGARGCGSDMLGVCENSRRAVQWSGGSEPAEVVGDMRKEAVKAEILFSGRVLREKRDVPPAVVCPTLTWHLVHEPTYCPWVSILRQATSVTSLQILTPSKEINSCLHKHSGSNLWHLCPIGDK